MPVFDVAQTDGEELPSICNRPDAADTAGHYAQLRSKLQLLHMGPAFAKAFTENAPNARICLDPFHVVQLGTKALEEVRKDLWRKMRKLPDPSYARKFAGARWALLKNPEDLRPELFLVGSKTRVASCIGRTR